MAALTEQQRQDLLEFELLSIQAGGAEVIDDDEYEVTGEADAIWSVSLSETCGRALALIKQLREERNTMASHVQEWREAWETCAETGFEEMLEKTYEKTLAASKTKGE